MTTMIPKPPSKKRIGGPNSHVIRVTVLGLAGITVDRPKCRDKDTKSSAPPPPSKMRAVVAFSRNSVIKGMTSLSKNLTRSPSDDIVVQKQQQPDDETLGETLNTSDSASDSAQRHVAVWAIDQSHIGSVVTFDTNLVAAANQRCAPQSFDLIVACAEDSLDSREHKVALPFGVAKLVIAGDECQDGRSMQLDIPVLSLLDANSLNSKSSVAAGKGLGGYPMIALSPKSTGFPKKGLKRLFQRQSKAKVPSVAARNAFADAYSMDATGDAILRISLEVFEKGSETERMFAAGTMRDSISLVSAPTPVSSSQKTTPTTKNQGQIPFDEGSRKSTNSPSDEDTCTCNTKIETVTSEEQSLMEESEILCPPEGRFDSAHFSDDDSGTYASNEDNVGYFAWNNTTGGEDDEYTLSFERPADSSLPPDEAEVEPVMTIDIFGRTFQIPSCASVPIMSGVNDGDSLTTRDTRGLSRIVNDIQDDMTTMTADFFGKSYSIPVCGLLKGDDEDDYTFRTEGDTLDPPALGTTETEKDNLKKALPRGWLDRFCTSSNPAGGDTISNHDTFSTLSVEVMNNAPKTPQKDNKSCKTKLEGRQGSSIEEKLPGTKKQTETATNYSPTSVKAFPQHSSAQRDAPPVDGPSSHHEVVKTLAELFTCRRNDAVATTMREQKVQYDQSVPPVVVPMDDASIGDLTATTLELNVASETLLLEKYKKKFRTEKEHQQSREAPSKTGPALPVPVAFGGDGVCPTLAVPAASPPIRVGSTESNSLQENGPSFNRKEDYFAEYQTLGETMLLTVNRNQKREASSGTIPTRKPTKLIPEDCHV